MVLHCFKPCYKWNTFNTLLAKCTAGVILVGVLNLVISGIPSILEETGNREEIKLDMVLNLVISGIPSILIFILSFTNSSSMF